MEHDLRTSLNNRVSSVRWFAAMVMLVFCSARMATAQLGSPASGAALMGTEYYVSFMPNEDSRGAAPRFMGLVITSEVPTTGDILIRKSDGSTERKSFSTQPGQITTIPIDRSLTLFYEDGGPSVHVTSRAPVAVFVLNSLYQSSGGYAAVPVQYWGNSYLSLTLPNADRDRVGQLAVIASENGTLVTITPSVRTTYREAWRDIVVTLNKGETFFIQARSGNGTADLSATEISATKPIGVISGHVRVPIADDGSLTTDKWASHISTMLLPDSHWGQEYLTVPMREGTPDRFRMVSAANGTTIQITHYPLGGTPEQTVLSLNRGDIFDASTINGKPISGPVRWSASGPVMLMQMRTSGGYGHAQNSPAALMVTPLDRFPTMAPFVAPQVIGTSPMTSHTLTIIAKGNSDAITEPSNPLNGITLDGNPLATSTTGGLTWTKIDNEYSFTRIPVEGGSHVIASGTPFNAIAAGDAGVLGDFYTWQVPFWLPKTEADKRAPYVVSHQETANTLTVKFSDRTDSYFSGIAEMKVVVNQNWRSSPFITPDPDDDVEVTFEATSDPSGPLHVMLRDRNGNIDTVKVFDGFCLKSAYAERNSMLIMTNTGYEKTESVAIIANPCGNSAEVRSIDLGTGSASPYLSAVFSAGPVSFNIAPYGQVDLRITVAPTAPVGVYTTDVTITLADATIVIPVRVEVGTSSVMAGAHAGSMNISALPNPFRSATRIAFGRTLGAGARLSITDPLGREVFHRNGQELLGQESLLWQGVDDAGGSLPSGAYFVSVGDAEGRAVIGTTLVR